MGKKYDPLSRQNEKNAEAKRVRELTAKGRGDAARAAAVARGKAPTASAQAKANADRVSERLAKISRDSGSSRRKK